jgi:hypothetical protein
MPAGPVPVEKALRCNDGTVLIQKSPRVGGIFYAVGFGYL